MFSKFKIERTPNVLYKCGPRHFEVEQTAISLPLVEAYDQRIRHLRAENEQLRAEKLKDVKIINGQAAELAARRAEVFQLRQELQMLRDEVAQSRLAVNPIKNTVKFNVSRKSYWDVDRAARSLKRKKIGDYLRNATEILPEEFKPIEVKFDVSGRELVMPLSKDQHDGEDDEGYSHEVMQRILAAKDEGLVSDKAYHELRMALPEKVRSHVPPLTTIKQERRSQNKEIKIVQIPEVVQLDGPPGGVGTKEVEDVLLRYGVEIKIPEIPGTPVKSGAKVQDPLTKNRYDITFVGIDGEEVNTKMKIARKIWFCGTTA